MTTFEKIWEKLGEALAGVLMICLSFVLVCSGMLLLNVRVPENACCNVKVLNEALSHQQERVETLEIALQSHIAIGHTNQNRVIAIGEIAAITPVSHETNSVASKVEDDRVTFYDHWTGYTLAGVYSDTSKAKAITVFVPNAVAEEIALSQNVKIALDR